MLLKKATSTGGRTKWEPAPLLEIERPLANAYGSAEGAASKIDGLKSVAAALNAGDVALAQIAAVLLALPDPLDVDRKVRGSWEADLSRDWDPDKHPRLGGPPNPGWFAPAGGQGGGTSETGGGAAPDRNGNSQTNRQDRGATGADDSDQQMAFAEPHDLIAIQNLGGTTFFIYEGRFLGGYYQETSKTGICDPTVWVKGGGGAAN